MFRPDEGTVDGTCQIQIPRQKAGEMGFFLVLAQFETERSTFPTGHMI
jgi:hypothetical protein